VTTKANGDAVPVRKRRVAADENQFTTPLTEREVRRIWRDELRLFLLRMVSILGGEIDSYSSRLGHGAPGLSAEENRRIARAIGVRRGRWWVYTAEQLAAYERGDTDRRTPANDSPPAPWDPLASLEAARARRARGAR
jgi:hypothetical protein